MEERIKYGIRIPLKPEELAALQEYSKENGLKIGELVRRCILTELKNKSTVQLPDFIPTAKTVMFKR